MAEVVRGTGKRRPDRKIERRAVQLIQRHAVGSEHLDQFCDADRRIGRGVLGTGFFIPVGGACGGFFAGKVVVAAGRLKRLGELI